MNNSNNHITCTKIKWIKNFKNSSIKRKFRSSKRAKNWKIFCMKSPYS